MSLTFEWHSIKAASNYQKHNITFEEASTVFYDDNALEMKDDKHSQAEQRFIILGASYTKRLLVVVFTKRKQRIRIISARPASRKERIPYEKNS